MIKCIYERQRGKGKREFHPSALSGVGMTVRLMLYPSQYFNTMISVLFCYLFSKKNYLQKIYKVGN